MKARERLEAPASVAVEVPAEPLPAPSERDRGSTWRRGALAPLKHRDFALFWTGAFISNAGTWLQNAVLAWVVLQITDSPFWTAMVPFAQFFPMLLFGLPGGLAADRLERRRVMIATQSVMMGVAFALAAITFTGHAAVATVLPVIALGGVALAFNAPAFQALVGDLVPRDVMLDAVSLSTAQFSAARVVGPVVGGIVVASIGAGWAFLINGLSFLAVIAALWVIRPQRQERPTSTGARALFGGVRHMNATPTIKAIIGLTSVLSFFTAPVIALLPVIARDGLRLGAGGYGGLFAAFSAGAVIGAIRTAWIVRRLGLWRGLNLGMATLAVAVLAVALSRNVVLTSLALAAVGFAYTATVSATNSALQVTVPASKKGRVMSLYMMAWAGLFPVGSLLAGAAATLTGAPATLAFASIPLAVATVVVRLRGKTFRSIAV
ncbi:MAG: MFS transporter [Actinomycetota bacterium]